MDENYYKVDLKMKWDNIKYNYYYIPVHQYQTSLVFSSFLLQQKNF